MEEYSERFTVVPVLWLTIELDGVYIPTKITDRHLHELVVSAAAPHMFSAAHGRRKYKCAVFRVSGKCANSIDMQYGCA